MAFSSERKSRALANGMVIEVHSFNSAGVTSGSISTGLGTIFGVAFNNETTEMDGKAVKSGQDVAISGVTSGDVGTIVVFGH